MTAYLNTSFHTAITCVHGAFAGAAAHAANELAFARRGMR